LLRNDYIVVARSLGTTNKPFTGIQGMMGPWSAPSPYAVT